MVSGLGMIVPFHDLDIALHHSMEVVTFNKSEAESYQIENQALEW